MESGTKFSLMKDYSKQVKRQIRELASLLYQRELDAELAKLDAHFGQWRQGKLSPFDLAEHIHQFHQHPARELYNKFSYNDILPMLVAKAIVDGALAEEEVPEAVREALTDKIRFFENELSDGV